ncbi:MAG: S-layer homology domain-containing protein [Clostridia bacterium]|nr:S-layer homology domain-containing protein [Clostridia bacterium]
MKLKKQICTLAAVAIATVAAGESTGFAYYSQTGTRGIYISGNTACKIEGEVLGISLWAPGKTYEDLNGISDKEKRTDVLAYNNYITSGADGFYEDTIEMKAKEEGDTAIKSGEYTLLVTCMCGETVHTESVIYSDPTENAEALIRLKAAADSADFAAFKDICDTDKYALGFVSDLTFDDTAAKMLYSYIKSNKFSASAPTAKTDAIDEFNRATVISGVTSGRVTNLFDYEKQLGLDKGELAPFLSESFVSPTFKAAVTARMKGASCTDSTDFIEALYKEFVFETVKSSDGYQNIVDVVNVFKSDIGLTSNIGQTQALRVMNKSYSDYETLKNDLTVSGGSSSSSGSGSGGGSSSGGSSYGSGMTFGGDYTNSGSLPETMNPYIFEDLDSVEWAKNAILELAQDGIINGKSDREFCPNDNITREEFVKLVVLALVPEGDRVPADVSFDDVDDNEWYADYVKIAFGRDIIKGVGDNRFGTGENITRQDASVIIHNTAVGLGLMESVEKSDIKFADENLMADYAKTAIYTMADNGIVNGVDGVNFAPCDFLTRAEAAKIIYGVYTISD